MNSVLERLNRAILLLESFYSAKDTSTSSSISKKKLTISEKERHACEEIKEILTSWNLPSLQHFDLNRALGLLFLSLDHRESSIRIIADQALDAIFRKFQLKFQLQRVIAILLTELSKKYPARCFCAALNKLSVTIHLSRAQRASVYGLHFMNSMCSALSRPEESIQSAIQQTFPVIFLHIGSYVGTHVEKAEELFRAALTALELSGPANRAGCVILAELSKFVPSILHKCFYKLAGIIFQSNDTERRAHLSGALITFRLLWETVVDNLTDISLNTLRKLLCNVLCCLYSPFSEVVVAALELLEAAVGSATPYAILDFNPFEAESNRCTSGAYNSPQRLARSQAENINNDAGANVGHSLQDDSSLKLSVDDGSEFGDTESLQKNSPSFRRKSASETKMEILSIEDLDNSLTDIKNDWNSIGMSGDNSLDYEGSVISEFSPVGRPGMVSRAMSQVTTDNDNSFAAEAEIVDPLLNCDNYLNTEEELAAGATTPVLSSRSGSNTPTSSIGGGADMRIPEYLPDEFYDGQQFLTDAFGFIYHDDDSLAIAALNFLFSVERSAILSSGKIPQFVKILSLISRLLQNRNSAQLKGIFQAFANNSQLLASNDNLLASSCECAISTFDCDYFLIKIARAEFVASITWCKASSFLREYYQPKCLDVLLRQLFDADQRVVRATCTILPHIVRNAEFEKTDIFGVTIPDWFGDSGLRRIPMMLGLNTEKYSFRCESNDFLVEKNLCYIIEALSSLAFQDFYSRQSGFLAGLSELSRAFPPSIYPEAWLTGTYELCAGRIDSSQSQIIPRNSFLAFFLEIAKGTCATIGDLVSLSQLIAALFAGIAENMIMQALSEQNSHSKLTLLSSIQSKNLPYNLNFPIESQILETALIFYLRIFNLYHTIVAEEKMRNFNSTSNISVFSRSGGIASPAAEKLSDLAKKITASGAESPNLGAARNSVMTAKSSGGTRTRINNFSYLVGTGIRQNRPTSYLHSTPLRNIESVLLGAYRNFLESIKPDLHTRFMEPLEAALDGFCVIVEMLDFEVVKTFLDEVLLYLRTIFDISVHSSANCIHQFLKAIFCKNAKYVNVKMLQSMRVKESLSPNDVSEMFLMKSINEFTIFTAFISHTEYMELFLLRNLGWLSDKTLQKFGTDDILQVADSLHLFDPFITRLMQIYPLTNCTKIRTAILDLLCTLLMNDVRYEMIDSEKKFYGRIIAQIRQLFRDEDVPLLGPIFAFLVTLSRVSYLTFSDVVSRLVEVLARVEENNALQVLEAAHVVLLESCRLCAINDGGHCSLDETKRRAQTEIKSFLYREFDFLFNQCPRAVCHLWILLLNAARSFGSKEWWTEISLDFLTSFDKFISSKKLISSNSSKTKLASIVNEVNLYGQAVVLSCCEASAFRPIDQFYGCVEKLFKHLQEPFKKWTSHSISPSKQSQQQTHWLTTNEDIVLELAGHTLPLIFTILCRLDEEFVMLRLNAIMDDDPADVLAGNFARMLFELTNCLHTQDTRWLESNGSGVEAALIFLIQIFIHTIRAGKAPLIISALRRVLRMNFEVGYIEYFSCSSSKSSKMLPSVIELGLVFPKAHAYWFTLLLTMNVRCASPEFYFFDYYLSHTKSLVCILLAEKINEKLMDRSASNSLVNTTSVNTASATNDVEQKFYTEKLFEDASEEFCARFLKWTEVLAGTNKISSFMLEKLSLNSILCFTSKLEHFLSTNMIDQLLPNFGKCLSMLPCAKDDKLILCNIDSVDDNEYIYRIKCYIFNKGKSANKVFPFMDIQHDGDNDFVSYTKLAEKATSDADFHKICSFIHLLNKGEILCLFGKIPFATRIRFFDVLFEWIHHRTKCTAVSAHILFDSNEADSNCKNVDSPEQNLSGSKQCFQQFSSSTTRSIKDVNNLAQNVIDAIFLYLADQRKSENSLCETVFLLSKCSELSSVLCQFREELFDRECVERLLNDLIMFLMTQRLEKKIISAQYFKALRIFFSFEIVRDTFEDDYYLVENLGRFLLLLWEETVEKIPRWTRLNIDKKHWNVNMDSGVKKLAPLRDEILEIFNIVQRIVYAFRNDLVRYDELDTSLAFKALLRLPLFAKMCVVPESALRLDWHLTMNARAEGIFVPLVNIHMLIDASVLSDFTWRVLWLGWTTKSQFEEFWMSLFGVLSSTPTALDELAAATASQTLHPQLEASCIAVEALTSLILSSLWHPQPGNTVDFKFLVKHRCRRENYLFLETLNGRLASCSNFWLSMSNCPHGETFGDLTSFVYTKNLDSFPSSSINWSNTSENYGLGQTSLDYLWSITGLLANEPSPDNENDESPRRTLRSSTSRYLIEKSTAPDTTSSLKALFENYLHWCANGFHSLPISLLTVTLKSMALLSDLIDDLLLYQIIFNKISMLFAINGTSYLEENDFGRGYAIYLLLKCASVVEWNDLLNYTISPSSSISTSLTFASEADFAKFLESVVENGLRRGISPNFIGAHPSSNSKFYYHQTSSQYSNILPSSPTLISAPSTGRSSLVTPQVSNFVGYCTLHGALYLLHSLAVDSLTNLVMWLTDFVMEELHRLQRPADILTDCSSDTIEYHKMVWTVAFRIVEEALSINPIHKTNFLKLLCNLFVDPRLPTWEKRLLTNGMESLVVHSCSYSFCFRQTALECFDTCQLRPSHLPFALSLYTTCLYREFNEGGECAYEVNKSFNRDFQKLLNIFLFYSTSPKKCGILVPVLADLIGMAWAKERIIENIWELISPIANSAISSSGLSPPKDNATKIARGESSALNIECPPPKKLLALSQFDRSLLQLLYEVLVKLTAVSRVNTLELCWNFLLPKFEYIRVAEFAQFLAALIFCAVGADERVKCRIGLLLESDTLDLSSAEFRELCKFLFDSFITMCKTPKKSNANWTEKHLLELLCKVNSTDSKSPTSKALSPIFSQEPSTRQTNTSNIDESSTITCDQQRISIFL